MQKTRDYEPDDDVVCDCPKGPWALVRAEMRNPRLVGFSPRLITFLVDRSYLIFISSPTFTKNSRKKKDTRKEGEI